MAADDVASAVAKIAVSSPLNGIVEVAGPEAFRLDDLIRRALSARGDPREVIADPQARYYGAELSGTLVGDGAILGETRFDDWLSSEFVAMSVTPVLQPFYEGWATHQRLLLAAIADLDGEQLALRPAPDQMGIWQLASHMAGSRAYWIHDVLGEGDPAIRDMFRVARRRSPAYPSSSPGGRMTRRIHGRRPRSSMHSTRLGA